MSLEKVTSVWLAETPRVVRSSREFMLRSSGRGPGFVLRNYVQWRGRRPLVEVGVARSPRDGVALKVLAGAGPRAGRVADHEQIREAETGSGNCEKDLLSSDMDLLHSETDDGMRSGSSGIGEESGDGDGDGASTASAAPWMSEEEAKAVVSEVILNGEDLSVIEYPGNEEAEQPRHPLSSLVKWLLDKINGDGRDFSLTEVGGVWKTGEEAGELKVPDISVSGFDVKDGVSPLAQWTSTELTMQHSQLARIVRDVIYLQIAFAFFGGVRIAEALLSVYSTSPPDFGKFKELLNALDPLTISWLANNVREPLEGLMEADPMDLEKVITLKSSAWLAVHAFFERQWKVMATFAMARSLSLIASHEPTTHAVTDKVQWLWNALMALPVF